MVGSPVSVNSDFSEKARLFLYDRGKKAIWLQARALRKRIADECVIEAYKEPILFAEIFVPISSPGHPRERRRCACPGANVRADRACR
jgi:hypothetical protein